LLTFLTKQAVLCVIECVKEAKKDAEVARKHARDAELNVERMRLELTRLEKLCLFDEESVHMIRKLVNHVDDASEGSKLAYTTLKK
jgi:hypothetical protein